jgi:hypothetical protein
MNQNFAKLLTSSPGLFVPQHPLHFWRFSPVHEVGMAILGGEVKNPWWTMACQFIHRGAGGGHGLPTTYEAGIGFSGW